LKRRKREINAGFSPSAFQLPKGEDIQMDKPVEKIVDLKGYRDGLHLIIDSEATLSEIEVALVERLANLSDSLAGISVTLDVGSRIVKEEQLNHLQQFLSRKYGLEVTQITDNDEETYLPDLRAIGSVPTLASEYVREDLVSSTDLALLVRHTLRAGQEVRFFEGNIVVLGDVNPGAAVIASGDIVVLGALRGLAHAGALGDASAVIIALDLKPTQIRIGHSISRPPDEKRRERRAEIASLKGKNIVVDEYKGT